MVEGSKLSTAPPTVTMKGRERGYMAFLERASPVGLARRTTLSPVLSEEAQRSKKDQEAAPAPEEDVGVCGPCRTPHAAGPFPHWCSGLILWGPNIRREDD
jgi:hypothetical protein